MEDTQEPRPVLILVGPTAAGKSRLALRIARELKTEIISADSRQVYRGMDIGTAKPRAEERARIPHHLIDVVDPDERFDAGMFRDRAVRAIEDLHRRDRIPLVVGGTGLYVRVLTEGLCDAPKADPVLRLQLLREEEDHGEGTLYGKLSGVDADSARRIHPKDRIRILRALEVYLLSGKTLSSWHREMGEKGAGYRLTWIGLTMDRAALYRKIDDRVEEMVAAGLEGEVRELLRRGYDERFPSMLGLGYRQWLGYFQGAYGREEAIRLLKRDTRRYAKRQMTWFRREERIRWIQIPPGGDIESLADASIGALSQTERSVL